MLAMQKYFESQMLIAANKKEVAQATHLSECNIDHVIEDYPEHFIQIDSSVYCTDSVYVHNYHERISPLIEDYLQYKMKNNLFVEMEPLARSTGPNVQNYFLLNSIYYHLSKPESRRKYYLDILSSNQRTVIIRGDSLRYY